MCKTTEKPLEGERLRKMKKQIIPLVEQNDVDLRLDRIDHMNDIESRDVTIFLENKSNNIYLL